MEYPVIVLVVLAILLTPLEGLPADNIRGPVTEAVRLQTDASFEQTVGSRYQEFVAIHLPEDTQFLEGVQIELVLSSTLRESYDSFGLVIYDSLAPPPELGAREFTGRRAFFHYLVPLNRLFYHLSLGGAGANPEAERHDTTQGVFRPSLPNQALDFPILVGIVPIMKGIPDALRDQRFYLRITPRVATLGLLSLRFSGPASTSQADYNVYLDGEPLETSEASEPIELSAGLHSLRVDSDTYQAVDTTFSIEPGQTNHLSVELKPLAGRLTIEAPSVAAVYIDGTRYEADQLAGLQLPPGEHTIRFKIGDYSSSRTFTVIKGKSYAIYLDLAIGVKEY